MVSAQRTVLGFAVLFTEVHESNFLMLNVIILKTLNQERRQRDIWGSFPKTYIVAHTAVGVWLLEGFPWGLQLGYWVTYVQFFKALGGKSCIGCFSLPWGQRPS